MALIDYVRELEGKTSRERGDLVLSMLRGLGLDPHVAGLTAPRIRNIVAEFQPDSAVKRLLFSAHYDVVKGSPGANDNASGVAVLLGLCSELASHPAPVTVAFFDHEEAWLRTPLLRLGLLGSFHYACTSNLSRFQAAYNLEFCGLGDFLGIWPVRKREERLAAVRDVEASASDIDLPHRAAHIPWFFFTSDHLPFRLRGLRDSVTLSLVPSGQVPALLQMVEPFQEGRPLKMFGKRLPHLEAPLSLIHSGEDRSSNLSEDSLQLMLRLLRKLVMQRGQAHTI